MVLLERALIHKAIKVVLYATVTVALIVLICLTQIAHWHPSTHYETHSGVIDINGVIKDFEISFTSKYYKSKDGELRNNKATPAYKEWINDVFWRMCFYDLALAYVDM